MEDKKRKFDFSKLKNLGTMDIKDVKNLFSKDNKEKTISTSKKTKKRVEKSTSVIAFDIGTNSIKMVEGKYYKGKLAINKLIEVPTPEGTVSDGQIINKDAIKDELGFALKENGVKAKDAICTTNSSLIINREVIIPKVEEEEVETVVRYEIQQYLPINLDDYILQYVVLDEIIDDKGEKLKLSVSSFPKKIAKDYYDIIEGLNLTPYALDVSYNSLKKLFNYSNNGAKGVKDGAVAFIDMGATSIDVTIFKHGKLDFTRIIKSGGYDIDYALSKALNMSVKSTESEKIKKANLLEIKEDDVINKVIKEVIDEMVEEIDRILQFYISKARISEFDNVYILGGTANIKGIDTYMTEKLNKNVIKINNMANMDISRKNISESEPICDYLNAIGAIIRL